MAFDVYIYASKRGEDTLIAHGGRLNDDTEAYTSSGPVTIPGAGPVIGEIIAGFDGKDPAELLLAVDQLRASTPHEQRFVFPALDDLRMACRHALAVTTGPHAELYESARVVVTKG